MSKEQFLTRFETAEVFRQEYEKNWSKGRAFLPEVCDAPLRREIQFLIGHPETNKTFQLRAEVVWVAEAGSPGVGFEFIDFDEALKNRLRLFVEEQGDAGHEHVHEAVRRLSAAEQHRWARRGNLTERVALERVYSGAVWESLLQNPNLTTPEVARIAKKGQLPQPLVGVICQNSAWLTKPEIQRALLSNPRVGGSNLDRVLRALSGPDLVRVPSQTAYRPQVRQAARALLKKRGG